MKWCNLCKYIKQSFSSWFFFFFKHKNSTPFCKSKSLFLIGQLKLGQLTVEAPSLLNRKSLSRVKHHLTCCLGHFVFLLAEGAWERPGLPALLACFSWGPWSRRKDPYATSPSGPVQGECVAFLTSWTLRAGCLGLWEWSHAQGPPGERGPTSMEHWPCVQGVGEQCAVPLPPRASTQARSAGL